MGLLDTFQFDKSLKVRMAEVGDTLTLGELIIRSQSNNAFLSVKVVAGLITAVYGNPTSGVREYWQAVPDAERLVLKRILTNPNAKIE